MVKKQSYTVIVLMMLLVTLAILLLNNPVNLNLPAVNLGSGSGSSAARAAETARAEAASAARWQAMGEAYTSQTSARSIEAVAADQARFCCIAIGKANHDLLIPFDDVIGRHNKAIGRPDEPGGRQATAPFYSNHPRPGRFNIVRQGGG